jgi:predicted DsbA family dithiol-disulfide isomerase
MKIVFYHSVLCPRCLLVGRTLKRLQEEHPDLVVEKVEVTTHPAESLRQGIRIIPALTAEGRKLSGLILTPAAVREFVEKIYPGPALD